MKQRLYIVIAILCSHSAIAGDFIPLQKSRAIFGLGTSLYYGDINENFGTAAKQMGISATAGMQIHASGKLYFSPVLTIGSLQGADAKGTQAWRNLSFKSQFTELSTEITYYPTSYYDFKNRKLNIHPYVGFGGGLLFFNSSTTYNDERILLQPLSTEGEEYSRFSPTLNLNLGISCRLNEDIDLHLGYQFHQTFTDYLDDVSGSYMDNNFLTGIAADVADRSFEGGTSPDSIDGTHWDEGYQRGTKKGADALGLLQIRLGFSL